MPRRFIVFGAGGYTSRPLRDFPDGPDEPELIERIAGHSSLRDEPEAVGDRWLGNGDNFWFRQQLANIAAARASRPALSTCNRIRDLQRRAKAARWDLSREIHEMTRDLDRARLGNRREPARVLARLEQLETRMDDLSAGGFSSAA